MTPTLDIVKEIVQQSDCQFKSEILMELEDFVQISPINRHKVSGAISVFGIKADFIDKENPAAIGFEELLFNLKHFDPDNFSDQFLVKGGNSGYEIFADFSKPILHGVLKLPLQCIEKKIELTENNQLKGTWSDYRFYLNGTLLNNKNKKIDNLKP
jgi:hypothetical protein